MLKGTYEQSVDAKGRMAFPAKLREQMGEKLVLTRGLDGCISVYTDQAFSDLEEKICALRTPDANRLSRMLISNSADVETDKQGRILIPARMRMKAGIENEAIVAGVADHCEIWNPDDWERLNEGYTDEALLEALREAEI